MLLLQVLSMTLLRSPLALRRSEFRYLIPIPHFFRTNLCFFLFRVSSSSFVASAVQGGTVVHVCVWRGCYCFPTLFVMLYDSFINLSFMFCFPHFLKLFSGFPSFFFCLTNNLGALASLKSPT